MLIKHGKAITKKTTLLDNKHTLIKFSLDVTYIHIYENDRYKYFSVCVCVCERERAEVFGAGDSILFGGRGEGVEEGSHLIKEES